MTLLRGLTVLCAVGAATAGGALFTFSTFTIEGLRRLPASDGAAAMQAINRQAPTPLFMLILFGTGAACLALGVRAAMNLDDPVSRSRLVACALYIVGVVLMTVGYHVPRNERLGALDPNSVDGIAYWAIYLEEWVRLNHVRTIAALTAALLLTMSLRGAGDVVRSAGAANTAASLVHGSSHVTQRHTTGDPGARAGGRLNERNRP